MDCFLNNLVGRWSLIGGMGGVSLYQDVTAQWVLKGLFVKMQFTSIKIGDNGNPDYEAIYLVGRDDKTNKYVLHLFDTFGFGSKPVPGIGAREGNAIRFRFDYDVEPWFNTFIGYRTPEYGRIQSPTRREERSSCSQRRR